MQSTEDSELPSSNRLIIFLHLPKTAGTSLSSLLSKLLWPSMYIGDTATLRRFLSLPDEERKAIEFAYGHMPYGLHRFSGREPYYVVFLRHPVDRIVSAYYYIKSQPEHERHRAVNSGMTLAEFAYLPENSNGLTRRLGKYDIVEAIEPQRAHDYWWMRGERDPMSRTALEQARECLDGCAFVGLQESFNTDVFNLLKSLGLGVPSALPRENETPVRPPAREIDPAVADLILERNLLDFELYRYARMIRGSRSTTDLSEWTLIPHGIDLRRAELVYDDARLEQDNGLHLTTATLPWSYAATVAIPDAWLGPVLIQIEIEVRRGALEVGFLSADKRKITGGQLVEAGPDRRTLCLFGREAVESARVLFRNGPETGAAEAVVHKADLYRFK